MKHRWFITSVASTAGGPDGPELGPDSILWVRCSGCGAHVTTTKRLLDEGRVHEDWRSPDGGQTMSADCRLEQILQVMES